MTRLRQIYEHIMSHGNPCEFSKECNGHRVDSYTCMKALDKSYCGMYNRHTEVDNSE